MKIYFLTLFFSIPLVGMFKSPTPESWEALSNELVDSIMNQKNDPEKVIKVVESSSQSELNQQDLLGLTPLITAVEYFSEDANEVFKQKWEGKSLIEKLLEADVDVNQLDNFGKAAMDYAVDKALTGVVPMERMVVLLSKRGAKLPHLEHLSDKNKVKMFNLFFDLQEEEEKGISPEPKFRSIVAKAPPADIRPKVVVFEQEPPQSTLSCGFHTAYNLKAISDLVEMDVPINKENIESVRMGSPGRLTRTPSQYDLSQRCFDSDIINLLERLKVKAYVLDLTTDQQLAKIREGFEDGSLKVANFICPIIWEDISHFVAISAVPTGKIYFIDSGNVIKFEIPEKDRIKRELVKKAGECVSRISLNLFGMLPRYY